MTNGSMASAMTSLAVTTVQFVPNVAMALPNFASPDRLWAILLVPILVLVYLIVLRMRNRVGMRYTNTGVLGAVLPKQRSWRRHVSVAMALASIGALALAWAQPLGTDKVPRQRATIVVVVDISMSMTATDMKPSRLAAEQEAALKFINSLPDTYNVAIVALSGTPSIRLPPSIDRAAAEAAITNLKPEDSTAIGVGIQEALRAISSAPKGTDNTDAPAAIVLLSDGQNMTGMAPQQAAAQAKAKKVKIYTIAFGTENGYVDIDGKRERVAPDTQLLSEVASITGGVSYAAADAGELKNVYKQVGGEVGYEEVKKPITAQYAFYALAFAVIAALGAVSMAARWPS